MLVNNYALDPAHISPSRSDAASNGHFPFTAGHMPTGTPRGFNLANMQFNFPGGGNGAVPMQGGGMPPANFPGFANGWNGAGGPPGGMGMPPNAAGGAADQAGLHNPGVIRRGGGRHGNRSGPYDRRGGRGGGMGRMPPHAAAAAAAAYIPPGHPAAAAMAGMAGPPGGGPPGRWDGAGTGAGGGAQAMGPREAVQGRSLKSYEDLDAVGGPGGGELNY